MTYGHIAAGALALVAAGVAVTPPALAQQSKQTTQTKQTTRAPDRTPQTPQQDLSTLRADIDALKQSYEARLNELEARLAKAEAETAEAKAEAADAKSGIDQVASAQPAPPPSAPSSQNAFNPGIAAVLNGFGVLAKHDPANLISGFAAGDESGGLPRGLSLGESEVSFTANIDPSLAGFLDFSLAGDNSVSLEEAYIRTTALEGGLSLKAGRFLSGIGYLNERHSHDWSFSDAPLPYRAFLNTQLADDGVQVRWLAPIDQYLEFGGEVFRGASFPAAGDAHNGAGSYTGFVKTGGDFDDSSSWLAGFSYVHAKAGGRETGTLPDLFTGDSDLGIASLVYKWAPGGNVTINNLTLAGEYFYGRDKGDFNGLPLSQAHSGWYAQGVYQFMPSWSLGVRLAGLDSENPGPLFLGSTLDDMGHSPFAATALLEYDTSEFGRLRLQYTHDQSVPQGDDQLALQYTVIYGPHGAHRY